MVTRLSERMSAIADMVSTGSRLADVGCDHAYIPIELCLEGRTDSAIAMDVKPGPLKRAGEHIVEAGLDDRIEIRQSDGLDKLGEDEADTVLIAGMGGLLIVKILTKSGIPISVTELVLAPQSEVSEVRKCVRGLGFRIVDEDMVLEDGKFYPVMRAVRDPAPADAAGEMEDAFGPVLLDRRHPVLLKWLVRERDVTERILARLNEEISAAVETDRLEARAREMEHKRELIAAALRYYE